MLDSKVETNKLWLETEAKIARQFNVEDLRTSGILAGQQQRWSTALVRLSEAVAHGVSDLQTLDFLGEAAFRTKAPEILLPFRALYTDPLLATHMARALFSIGEFSEAEEYLRIAQDSPLKKGIQAVMGIKNNIEDTMQAMLNMPNPTLDYPTYWQALSAVADVANRDDLVTLAEERSKALDYANPVIHFNQGIRFLKQGQVRAGWRLYDWCLHPESNCAPPSHCCGISMWQGESLKTKNLLVLVEFGFGEQIFNLRFIKRAISAAKKIELGVHKEIFELAKASFPEIKIHPIEELRQEIYWQNKIKPDFFSYAFSLPCRLSIDDPAESQGYLAAPTEIASNAKAKIQKINPKNLPIFGIVWHGEQTTPAMRTRAYSLEEFLQESKVLQSPCVIVCLQKDATQEEIVKLKHAAEKANCLFLNAQDDLINFAVTAGWIKALDRLYSCDTSVAHLGGALGHPTTLLRKNKAIWQWIQKPNSTTSFWYDSVTILDALVPKHSFMFDLRT